MAKTTWSGRRFCFFDSATWMCFLAMLIIPVFGADSTPHKASSVRDEWGWSLPQTLSDNNTRVSFDLSSTWHNLHGTSSRLSGNVWLENRDDPLSIRATINFPVAHLSTGGELRDARMLEVMDSEHHHFVTLAIDSIVPQCDVKDFILRESCSVVLTARLSIRGTERTLSLPGTLSREETSVELNGSVRFSWLDFGVEDPSIIVAKLHPEMQVSYSVTLPSKR